MAELRANTLGEWEQRQLDMHRVREARRGFPDRRGLRTITVGEWCFLMRRRSGLSMKEVSRKNNISHVALIRRERGLGKWQELKEFWDDWFEAQGA